MIHKDRIALVTGANRGIGREVAFQIAKQGLVVLVGCRKHEDGLRVKQEIEDRGGRADVITLDVTSNSSIKEAKTLILDVYGKLDVLVNNAGILIDKGDFYATGWETVLETFETNVLGAFGLCQAFLPSMTEHNFGRIVNVSSGMGQLSEMNQGYPAYRISKTALNAVTKMVSEEVKNKNIKVNSVCPGWVMTDMGGSNATRSVDKGAETIVWAALLPNEGPTGRFLRDKKEIEW